jgi:hypothetical protein
MKIDEVRVKIYDKDKDTWPEGHPKSRFNADGSRKDGKQEDVKRPVTGSVDFWKAQVKKHYPEEAAKLRFVSKDNGKHISAEIPGKDRSYGIYVISKNRGEILGEEIGEVRTMELLNELFGLLEDTAGLSLGAFKLDKDKILTKIGNKTYSFTPKDKNANVAELFNSVTGVAKHSTGRALAFLKKNAVGVPVSESVEIVEDIADQTVYKKLDKLEDAVSKLEIVRKAGAFSVSIVAGIRVYYIRNKYFAAWDPEKRRGIVDPDFKGKAPEIIDQLKEFE